VRVFAAQITPCFLLLLLQRHFMLEALFAAVIVKTFLYLNRIVSGWQIFPVQHAGVGRHIFFVAPNAPSLALRVSS
jgi:hypothetical protein